MKALLRYTDFMFRRTSQRGCRGDFGRGEWSKSHEGYYTKITWIDKIWFPPLALKLHIRELFPKLPLLRRFCSGFGIPPVGDQTGFSNRFPNQSFNWKDLP